MPGHHVLLWLFCEATGCHSNHKWGVETVALTYSHRPSPPLPSTVIPPSLYSYRAALYTSMVGAISEDLQKHENFYYSMWCAAWEGAWPHAAGAPSQPCILVSGWVAPRHPGLPRGLLPGPHFTSWFSSVSVSPGHVLPKPFLQGARRAS